MESLRMKIAVISNVFSPHVIGGYELGCLGLARAAQAAGHRIRVLTSRAIGRLQKRDRASDLDVKGLFTPIYDYENIISGVRCNTDPAAMGGILPANVIALQYELESFQPDAIWIFNPIALGPVGIFETAVASGIPTTVHLMDHFDGTVADHQVGFNVLPRWIRAKSKMGAIACSRKTLETNQVHGTYGRTTVIPNGVSFDKASQPVKSLPGDCVNFVYFGQIESHKGILQLIDAFALLKKRHSGKHLQLHLIGSGSESFRSELDQSITRHRLERDVVQHGFIPPSELPERLDTMHAAVFPLRPDEPFAYVVIEAIRAGLPTIVSRHAGVAEFLPQQYPLLLHDRDNSSELASLMGRVLLDNQPVREWTSRLQTLIREICDLDRSCLPRCIEFLREGSGVTQPRRHLADMVNDGLASWQSSLQLQLATSQPNPAIPVGKRLERWVRRKVPTSTRYFWKRQLRWLSSRKAG
ncbi:MAG: glycosyltransferase [Planctomycetota bacterium]|nr:MAG: glycosyltransferase [Planctomycetota bacterium]